MNSQIDLAVKQLELLAVKFSRELSVIGAESCKTQTMNFLWFLCDGVKSLVVIHINDSIEDINSEVKTAIQSTFNSYVSPNF